MTDTVIAAQMYTAREFTKTTKDAAESLKKVREIGYEAVQISAFGADIDFNDIKQMLDDNGLYCCITHIGYDRLKDDLPAVIEQHKLWNCPNVAIGSMPGPFRESGVDGVKKFAAEANEIGRQLHEAGLTFSYHNHSFEFARAGEGKETIMDILFDETDPKYVQAELDTYWVQHGGADPATWILKMKDRMPVVHVKDMTIEPPRTQVMAEVGEGNLNWPAILDACKEAGVQYYAVEQDICPGDPFDSLAISYKNMRAMGLK